MIKIQIMNSKNIFIYFIFLLLTAPSFSQTVGEAVRYSSYDYSGTARSVAVGGAFSALGADMSAISVNPAGLGEYRFGEFVFSMGFIIDNQNAILGGQENSTNTSTGNLGVLGYVSTNRHRAGSPLSFSSFGISLNRFLSFDNSFEFSAITPGSITERFAERANGLGLNDLDDFEAGPAFDAGAIFDFDGDNFYETDFGDFSSPVFKRQTVTQTGSGMEASLGYGASFNNKFSLGANIGIPFFTFEETKNYVEFDDSNTIDFFEDLIYEETLETSGFGINAKLGVIYKPTNRLRVSVAGHSPSLMILNDIFFTDFTYTFSDNAAPETITINSPNGEFEYQFRTPWRAIVGAAYMFKLGGELIQRRNEEDIDFADRRKNQMRGFISGEVEYVSFTNASFNLTANSSNPLDEQLENALNGEIGADLQAVPIIKLGAELAKGNLRYRAGVRYEPSIYKSNSDTNIKYSGGLGIRINRVFVDLAGSFNSGNSTYSPYLLTNTLSNQNVTIQQRKYNIDLTFGLKV